jgi:hypothetical protein
VVSYQAGSASSSPSCCSAADRRRPEATSGTCPDSYTSGAVGLIAASRDPRKDQCNPGACRARVQFDEKLGLRAASFAGRRGHLSMESPAISPAMFRRSPGAARPYRWPKVCPRANAQRYVAARACQSAIAAVLRIGSAPELPDTVQVSSLYRRGADLRPRGNLRPYEIVPAIDIPFGQNGFLIGSYI